MKQKYDRTDRKRGVGSESSSNAFRIRNLRWVSSLYIYRRDHVGITLRDDSNGGNLLLLWRV